MKHYAGFDVSMKTTFITIINEERKIVFEDEVETDPKVISSTLKATGIVLEKCAMESGSLSHWLGKALHLESIPVICVDARKMSRVLSININKTDKNDARLIAEALRCGFYSEVSAKSQEHAEMQIWDPDAPL